MPRICEYDSETGRVVGWFETVHFQYANLPPKERSLELTDAEWDSHFDDPSDWYVVGGKLKRGAA
jgi:hypothetical protein